MHRLATLLAVSFLLAACASAPTPPAETPTAPESSTPTPLATPEPAPEVRYVATYAKPDGWEVASATERRIVLRIGTGAEIDLVLVEVPPAFRIDTPTQHAERMRTMLSDPRYGKAPDAVETRSDGSATFAWKNLGEPTSPPQVGRIIFRSCAELPDIVYLCMGQWSEPSSAFLAPDLESACASIAVKRQNN